MKKVLSIIIICIFTICFNAYVYAETNCVISLNTSKTNISKNEEFEVEVVISNIQLEKGIIALGAVLEYDKDKIELIKMDGKNGWSAPSYNEQNGKMIMDRNSMTSKNETIFKITFKAKEQGEGEANIILKNISVANGYTEAKIENATCKITILKGDSTTKDSQNKEISTIKNNNKNNSNSREAQEKRLPKTGVSDEIFLIGGSLFVGASVFFLRKYNKI